MLSLYIPKKGVVVLKTEDISIKDIKPYKQNAKKHPADQVEHIANSIREFGFRQPLVIDKDNVLVIGHGRLLAAKKLGITEVPCVRADDLTEEQIKALRLADNKTNESEWDFDLLGGELDDILDIDMSQFGFDISIDEEPTEIVEDEIPEEVETRCKLGDLWQLGEHRLICGDSTDVAVIDRLMDGVKADLYLTDPPYNVNYTDGHENERKIMNDHFDTDEECGEKLWFPAFSNALTHSKDCCSVYCFMPQGGTHMMMMMMMMMKAGWQVKHELIWRKQSIVLNRADYNYQHEPFMYGWNKTHKFYGKGKYKNTSVWEFDRQTKSKEHPTMKPVELLGEILLNATEEGNNVLDTFGGSGSTLIACEQLNRKCFMAELDPYYISIIVQRWLNLTGRKNEIFCIRDGERFTYDEVFN